MKIVFFGTSDFAVPSINKILQSNHQIVSVVTGKPKKSGRGQTKTKNAVHIVSEKLNLPILNVENVNDSVLVEKLKIIKADIFIVVAFKILPEKIFSIPKHGTVNLHASLLPKYRGAAPIHHAILCGDTQTGVSTFNITNKVDAGRILLQAKCKINKNTTTGQLWQELSVVGAKLLVNTLDGLQNSTIKPIEQNLRDITLAPKLHKKMFLIEWTKTSSEIHNQIRAFSPKPGAFTYIKSKRVKLFESEIASSKKLDCGKYIIEKNKILVGTSTFDLIIKSIHVEGKKRMTISDYCKGINKNNRKNLKFG